MNDERHPIKHKLDVFLLKGQNKLPKSLKMRLFKT